MTDHRHEVAAAWARPHRPSLRRPPLGSLALYRLRVELDGARPPIWRELDVRSDVTLDVVHDVLQAAFDWTDSHLHRFSIGGGPFDRGSELFLCPFDVDEGEDDGTAAREVRLDEVLQEPGDVLQYVYDYGDGWEVTLRLERVLPAPDGAPTAVCVDGARAAPPEDCGGVADADQLAQLLDDPAYFDVGDVNRALRSPFVLLRERRVQPAIIDVMSRLRGTAVGDHLVARLLELTKDLQRPGLPEMTAALRAHQWFLDRAVDGGIGLTSAGYLKPVDVEAACRVVPTMPEWYGKNNRESHASPLLAFRKSLQHMGLLRKYKDRLLPTRAGAAAREDVSVLWCHLVEHLAPRQANGFAADAAVLLLVQAAAGGDAEMPLDVVVGALNELGWHYADGEPVNPYSLYGLDRTPEDVLRNVADQPVNSLDHSLSPVATALARAALLAAG